MFRSCAKVVSLRNHQNGKLPLKNLVSNNKTEIRSLTQTRSTQSLVAQLRREKLRQNLLPKEDLDAPVFVFPRERLGNDYTLNWQLCALDIVPQGESFRNLYQRQLLQQSIGKTDSNKAIHVQSDAVPTDYKYSVAEQGNPEGAVLSTQQFGQIFKELKQRLSESPSLFLHDGAVGSHAVADVAVRVVTSDPNVALYLNHALPRLPLRQVENFTHNLLVYHDSQYQVANPAKVGLKGKAFSVYNKEKNLLVIGGTNSTRAISQSLFEAVGYYMSNELENTRVPLVGDAITLDNGKNVIVINHDNLYLKQKIPNKIFGAHNLFWTPSGIVRAWQSVTYPSLDGVKLQRGDLVEKMPDGSAAVTQPKVTPNLSGQPSSVVFLVADSQGILPTISKLNPTQAAQHYVAGYNGKSFNPVQVADVAASVNSFKQLVTNNQVGVYIINSHQSTPADLQKIITATVDGSANSAPTGSGFKTLVPLNALGNVKVQGGNNAKENLITDFIKAKFPNVTF